MPIGLYIHVPFCLQKCRYCDFVSYRYHRDKAESYLTALEQEMCCYGQMLAEEHKKIDTVFVGGGTPTVLEQGHLSRLLAAAKHHFYCANGAEITVEANPGTIDKQKLQALKQAGVTRLSLGVQACQQRLLKMLGRVHNYQQAVQAVKTAREVGFDNINLDLIFAIPGQSLADWRQSLRMLTALQPEHLACYSLQLEEGTPLTRAVERGEIAPCSEELDLAMYNEVINYLTNLGYQHYEISNFARPAHQSHHNLLYWHNQHYIGLGPAAHSHMHRQRWANTSSLQEYVAQINQGYMPVAERMQLNVQDEMCETVFMGLRLLEGINLTEFQRRFGQQITEVWPQQVKKLIKQGLLDLTTTHLKLTPKGLPLANIVFAEFI